MTKWILIAVGVLAVLAPSAAANATIVEPEGGHYPYQRWVDEAKVPTPDGAITVVETSADHGCPGRELNYDACTKPAERLIWFSPDAAAGEPREIFLHEIGHNVDHYLLPTWMRVRFMVILRLSGTWQELAEPQPYTPAEVFADTYAECALRPYYSPRHLGFQPRGGAVNHNRICRMLARL